MATESKQNIKQLKVDNWGVFFLQRLQLLFAKGDCCDLTLKFIEGQELKVHRLVLNTCTSYFESSVGNKHVFDLPETLTYSALQPIINFMYSGRLEFRPDLHPTLLSTAKILKMEILVKLLHAQPKIESPGVVAAKATPETKKSPPSPATPTLPATKTVSALSTSTPTLSSVIPGKKHLPIWRKRNIPLMRSSDMRHLAVEEDPRPTRFEWPGEDSSSIMMSSPSFASISYESMPVLQSPVSPPSSANNNKAIKRRVVPPVIPVPEKMQKTDDANGDQTPQEPISDDDDDDDGHFETIHNYDESDEENMPESSMNQLKPILKPTTDSHNSAPSKKVRFSLENDDLENKNSKALAGNVSDQLGAGNSDKAGPNHAKIIAEVLKKFPELVRNNKNIKLKITTPSPSSTKTTTFVIDSSKGNKVASKSSYVVMKAEKTPPQPTVVEKPHENMKAENTTGPWQCKPCGTEENALNFESYYLYRKHLQDVHMERLDSRVCEHCGFKASKRNLHLYHLYTKHNIAPPKNIKFPKCNQCNYIALSESLLIKHQNNHQSLKELTCQVCNSIFKTSSSLQAHSVTCKPDNEMRNYICKYCKKYYRTNVGLNAHLKICQDRPEGEVENDHDDPETMEMIEVPVIETVGMEKGQHTLLQLPTGIILAETPNMALLPSSESDSLTNVSSGIATSIGLTVALPEDQAVILLDENSEFFLQGNNSVVVSNNHSVEEYIVPEILHDNVGHIYSTATSIPYTVSGTNVIAYPVMHVQTNKELQVDGHEQSVKNDNSDTEKQNLGEETKQDVTVAIDDSYTEDDQSQEETENISSPTSSLEEKSAKKPDKSSPVVESEQILTSTQTDESPTPQEEQGTNLNSEVVGLTKYTSEGGKQSSVQIINKNGAMSKAKTIEGDWDFENDDEASDVSDDPELKPSRPTIDLEELP